MGFRRLALLFLAAFTADIALAAGDEAVMPVLLGLVAILFSAKAGAFVVHKFAQPGVLGELLAGVVIGNLVLLGLPQLEFLKTSEIFAVLAGLGAILLLFEVGLESDLAVMMRIGREALIVAIAGILFPSVFGYYVSSWLDPAKPQAAHLFVGAVLAATSIGITARVLKELNKVQTREGKIILGAAVIDDVLGLILLAVVSGIVVAANAGRDLDVAQVGWITFKAIGFLVTALVIGVRLAPKLFKFGGRLEGEGVLLLLSLLVCFILAYLSGAVGLAPIIGAFAAGLIIDGTSFEKFFSRQQQSLSLEEQLLPLSRFLAPVFFVMMGVQVDLRHFVDPAVVSLGLALTLAAIVGKLLSGIFISGKNTNRWAIGFGMVPRGEVGLIFAAIGAQLTLFGQPVINAQLYSAVVFMVMVTTMITPPALQMVFGSDKSLSRQKKT